MVEEYYQQFFFELALAQGIMSKAEELLEADPSLVFTKQFENAANPWVHRLTTGPEIWAQTQGKIDTFISGVGTGGTVTGNFSLTCLALRELAFSFASC